LDQPTVLIISDKAEFAGAITGRWQSERNPPIFTLMSVDLCQELDSDTFDIAIVSALPAKNLRLALAALHATGKPAVLVCADSQTPREVRDSQPRILVLRQHEGWLEALVLLASEMLRRCEIAERLRRMEAANALLQQHAALGKYMLEMRHNLNNALTSVLGNSELLLLEPDAISAGVHSQIETIRNMSLRMHEILQRFSSLEKELAVVAKQLDKESDVKSKAARASN
jgi:signal transduction histidine kinase